MMERRSRRRVLKMTTGTQEKGHITRYTSLIYLFVNLFKFIVFADYLSFFFSGQQKGEMGSS